MKCKNKIITCLICVILIITNIPFQFHKVYAASNIVDIAKGEVGVSGSPNKYTKWNGSINGSYSYAWCQAFASWCADQAGLSAPKTASCAVAVTWFKNNGKWASRSSGYVPQAGDFIYFDWGNNGGYDHVGIVNYVSAGRVYTIEGNTGGNGGTVKYNGGYSNGYALTDSQIIGYGKMGAGSDPVQPDKTNEIFACVDEVRGGVNSVKIVGWVFDRIDLSRAVEVHVYIGDECHSIMANQSYKSVDDYYGCGEYHGISVEIPTDKAGEQEVSIYAITPETGRNPKMGETKTVNIIQDHEKPVISNITVSNVSSQGYTITCEVTDNVGIERVQFPTWTEYGENDGQDDIIPGWQQAPEASGTINGNKVSYRVNTSGHNNETGTYFTHIYAYDKGNNVNVDSVKVVLNNGLTPAAVSSFNGHIYAVFNEAYSWKEAKALCESMGGHLATITSKEENDFVKTLLDKNFYYIGATDEQTEGTWKWVTGEEFSYTNWETGQPDNAGGSENFLMMYSDGIWNDLPLKYSYTGFVLEIDDMGTPVNTVTENGSVYEMYDVTVPWEVAEKYCEMKGGTLVCITSEKEEKIIEDMIGNGTKRIYQFGATDKETEGVWKWMTGEDMSYSLWAAGEKNNRSGDGFPGPENYLVTVRGQGWFDMKSYPGDSGFILEKKADLAVSGKTDISNAKKGDKVTISAAASGGSGSYTYSYLIHNKDTNQWSRLTPSFINNSSYIWTAGSAGNREFFVEAKDSTGTVARSSAVNVKVTNPLSITAKANTSKVSIGSRVIISGTASGGNGNYTYSYLIHNKDTNQWSRLTSSFTSSNSYTWTAGSAGNREFFVEVKDNTGKVVRSNAVNVNVETGLPLKISGKADKTSVLVGNKVIISGTASGGKGPYTYSYLVHNKDTNQWSRLTSSFTSSNSYTWTAGSAGNREFFVEAKDSTGKVVRSNAVNIAVAGKPLAITGKASTSAVTKGGKVTISGIASGGSQKYTYSFLIHNKNTNEWSRLSSFGNSNTYIWTAGSIGNREFFVETKDSSGKVVRSNAINVKVDNTMNERA